jgi:hypothetical protein
MNDLGSGCLCNCVYDVRYILSNFFSCHVPLFRYGWQEGKQM